MCLADDGVSDPEGFYFTKLMFNERDNNFGKICCKKIGIKLRAVKGLKGCKYLDPGAITDALSYVMGPLAEMLEVQISFA